MGGEVQMTTVTNPLLERIRLPGMTFRLPSLGMFYDKTILDSDNGEVHVHPLMAIDELLIRNPDKILNGKAIEEIFLHCIPEVRNAKKLLSKDVDFLMLALRRVSYGPTMEVSFKHTCKNAKEHEYVFDLERTIASTRTLDPTTAKQKHEVTLENNQIVKIIPIRFDYNIEIMQLANEMLEKQGADLEHMQRRLFESTANVIESVDGITDQTMIREWIKAIPSTWYKEITKTIEALSQWGVTPVIQAPCKDCNELLTIDVPVNPVNFFT